MQTISRGLSLLILIVLMGLQGCRTVPLSRIEEPEKPANDSKAHYDDFAHSLDLQQFKEGYPALVRKLASQDQYERITALRTIGQSGEINAIPLIVPIVLSEKDRTVRIWAGSALQWIVTTYELKRRDPGRMTRVVILPRSPTDVDLRPLSWVFQEMLAKPDDGSTHSYAATMIGYLGLKRFEPDLRRLLESRHPAVTRSAVNALQMLGFEVEKEPHPLERER